MIKIERINEEINTLIQERQKGFSAIARIKSDLSCAENIIKNIDGAIAVLQKLAAEEGEVDK